jgi:hypothetical protein
MSREPVLIGREHLLCFKSYPSDRIGHASPTQRISGIEHSVTFEVCRSGRKQECYGNQAYPSHVEFDTVMLGPDRVRHRTRKRERDLRDLGRLFPQSRCLNEPRP